jgi:hypothetical protein
LRRLAQIGEILPARVIWGVEGDFGDFVAAGEDSTKWWKSAGDRRLGHERRVAGGGGSAGLGERDGWSVVSIWVEASRLRYGESRKRVRRPEATCYRRPPGTEGDGSPRGDCGLGLGRRRGGISRRGGYTRFPSDGCSFGRGAVSPNRGRCRSERQVDGRGAWRLGGGDSREV